MTKGSGFDFIGLYAAILKDIAAYFPIDQREWDRDLSRITTLFQTRGPAFSTMDLPQLGKALDKGLSSGALNVRGMPLSGPTHAHSMIPRLFRGLWKRVFDDSGCLRADVDPNVVLFLRELLYVGKNFKSECAPRYLFEATEEFFHVDSQLPSPSSIWDGDGSDVVPRNDHAMRDFVTGRTSDSIGFFDESSRLVPVLDTVQIVADRISGVFSGFDPGLLHFKHGPGAVSDLGRGEYKYTFPNWAPRLEYNFPFDISASTSLEIREVDPSLGYGWDSYEPHSVLIAVPKTMKGPRLIAKEPTCHQWIQQGIRDFLYQKVAHSWMGNCVNFFDQEPSRLSALQASLTGKYATIDLKSASDRISCSLVERYFRRNPGLLSAMVACRTRFLSNPIDKRGPSLLKLRKFSTQGSALTFPIQSIIFLGICLGVGTHLNPTLNFYKLARQVRIFGDDLIIPREWEPLVREVLSSLCLRVNLTKTHADGYFRESCGMDAYRGYDVSPAYVLAAPVESDPATVASALAVSNNFYKKGFWNTMAWLERSMPRGILNRIPVVKTTSGLFARVSFGKSCLPKSSRTRWNHSLHYDEFSSLTIVAKQKKTRTDTVANLLQFFTEEPPPNIRFESGLVTAGVPLLRNAWVRLSEVA
jgi:hypothetical protein